MAELPELRHFLERVLEREALTEHEASETLRALADPALPPALAGALLAALRRVWPVLAPARIVGHSDVAPGRKTDPGPSFDWARIASCCAPADGG